MDVLVKNVRKVIIVVINAANIIVISKKVVVTARNNAIKKEGLTIYMFVLNVIWNLVD